MNAQTKYNGDKIISLGIEWCSAPFGPGTGYTANPVKGCAHDCHWEMPDGTIVECYAQALRDRLDGKGAFKTITFHPEVSQQIKSHKQRAGIFIDSMSDLCGQEVKSEWITETISVMRECPRHIFFVLTKNALRLKEFEWPDNAFIGLSSPPAFIYGKRLTPEQQQIWFSKGMEWLHAANAKFKWASLEPLSTDAIVPALMQYNGCLDWAVIGAGSNGQKTFQPDEDLFADTIGLLSCPIWYKGNLDRSLAQRHGGWREEFPLFL